MDALHGLLLPSGNDASNVIAEAVGALLPEPDEDTWEPIGYYVGCVAGCARYITRVSVVMHTHTTEVGLAMMVTGSEATA